MSDQTNTAVAVQGENAALAAQIQSTYQRDRMIRQAAAAIAGESWGKALSPHTQAAVARYALEAGLDPVRHLYVLGGNIYVNAEAYRDLLAARGAAIRFENITANPEARAEWCVPEHAKAAYVCVIELDGRTYREASYAPKKKSGDSVGEQFPGEKARTSAIRRCARMAVPVWSAQVQAQAEAVESLIGTERAAFKAEQIPPPAAVPAPRVEIPARHADTESDLLDGEWEEDAA